MDIDVYPCLLTQKLAIRKTLNNCSLTKQFGCLLKETRLKAGFENPHELANIIQEHYGVAISGRSIYRYERGQSSPHIDFLVAASLVFSPSLFIDLFSRTLKPHLTGTFELSYKPIPFDPEHQLMLFDT